MARKRDSGLRTPLLGALGAAVAQMRREAGLSQQELGDRSGVNPKALSALERGRRNPTYETLSRITQGLGVSIAALASLADKLQGKC